MYWYKSLPTDKTIEHIKQRKSPTSILRRTFVEFVILGFFIGVAYFLFSGLSYVDIRDNCYIKVKYDVLQGDRQSIIDALKRIKKENYLFYKRMCSNIDRIYEKRCVLGEDNTPKLNYTQSKGCYIRGSRVILINPVNENDYDKVEKRVEAIRLYAQMSIDYWDQHPQTE